MAAKALKFGLIILGLGVLSFIALLAAMGPLGPCARGDQEMAVLLGFAGTGIGGLMCLISLPAILFQKHKARGVEPGLSALKQPPRNS
jgi:hypothetical protein